MSQALVCPISIELSGFAWGTAPAQASVYMDLPVPLRASPTINYTLSHVIQNGEILDDPSAVKLSVMAMSGSQLRMRVTRPSGNWLPNYPIHILGSYFMASSEP